MSDIFISYEREDQATARKLADALEGEGWTVWWDPKLRAGERFNDVIEKALKESKCVVVMWSKCSVESKYVRDEATYALNRNKLVPIMIDEVDLPFRFEGLQTPSLLGWGGSHDAPKFRMLAGDIASIIGQPATEAKGRADEDHRKRIEEEKNNIEQELQPSVHRPVDMGTLSELLEERRLEPGTVFRDKLKDGSQGPEMVVVPAGTFKMGDIKGTGDKNEKPVHTVRIAKPFAIGRYAITFDEYDRFVSATGRPSPDDKSWGRGRQPAINVSWDDAGEYA